MNSILVCIDFSDISEKVVAVAAKQAHAFNAKVKLLHVAPPAEPIIHSPEAVMVGPSEVAVAVDVSTLRSRLHALSGRLAGLDLELEVREGRITDEILDEIKSWRADMVVMGSHGHGALYELLVGSVTESILRHVKVPVLVVPSQT